MTGSTGFVVDSIDAAVAAVPRAIALDRSRSAAASKSGSRSSAWRAITWRFTSDVFRRGSANAVVLSARAPAQRGRRLTSGSHTGQTTPAPERAGDEKRRRFTSSRTSPFRSAGRAPSNPVILSHCLITAAISSPGEGNSDGIYLHDTRFLSQLELRLNGAPLLLLSSNVQEDNAVLTVDLANPELISRDGARLRGELIHVNRLKYIWQDAYYERLLVHNFDTRRHDLRLGSGLPPILPTSSR